MQKFIIERALEGAGQLSSKELQSISQRSCDVLRTMGTDIQWVESYVTDNKIYCVYLSENAGLIRKHAEAGEFPVDHVNQVRAVIDPTTAEPALV